MKMNDFDWDSLQQYGFTEKATGDLKDSCWNCVKIDSKHSEGDIATAEMTPNYLPEEPGTGPAKNPQMKEAGIRMPRIEEITKASNNNGQLAMAAAPNYNEFYSTEPNGRMILINSV